MTLPIEELRNPALRKFAEDHLSQLARLTALGAPILADVDRIVTSANMKVGSYTVAASPDIARNITVTATAVGAADTMGTILVTGTNIDGVTITETIIPATGSTVAGTKAFKTVVSVVGAGWVINEANDTITIGVGIALGLPVKVATDSEILLGVLGTAFVVPTNAADNTLEGSTVDISSATYDGSKKAFAFIVE